MWENPTLGRNDYSNCLPDAVSCLSTILSENRCTLFGIMLFLEHDLVRKPLHTFRDHA